jgi:Rrf2 family protein
MSYSLSFTKAVLVVVFVADKIRQGQFEFLSTATISEVLNIPKPTLVKILRSLNADGIIETKEGKQGGVRLLRDPKKISVLEILHSVEKGKTLFNTSYNIMAEGKRPDKAQQSVSELFGAAEKMMANVLAGKSVADILEDMND